jgi:hypothetical protein
VRGVGRIERDFGVGQDAGRRLDGAERRADHAEHFLDLVGPDVRLLAEQVVEVVGIRPQARLTRQPVVERGAANVENFGLGEGRRAGEQAVQAARLLGHRTRALIGRVDGLRHRGVDVQAVDAAEQVVTRLEPVGEHVGAVGQMSSKPLQREHVGAGFCVGVVPRAGAVEDAGGVPLVAVVDLLTGGENG